MQDERQGSPPDQPNPGEWMPDASVAPPEPPAALSARTKAWISMAALFAALLLLSLFPEQGHEAFDASPSADVAGASSDPAGALAIGKPAPLHFTLKDSNGVDVRLESFKGKVILLNFWATWCGPCRVEIPHLVELQDEYADDLVVLGVSVDDTADKMRAYAAEMKINYPLLVAADREDLQNAYGPLWGIPVSVFIARDGTVHKKHAGIATKEQFEREIKAALAARHASLRGGDAPL